MRPKSAPNYLAAYPATLAETVQQLIAQGTLGERLLQKYPTAHDVRNDRALYEFVSEAKSRYLRNTGSLSRVAFDSTLHVERRALGMHTTISRVQGGGLKSKREIRVAAVFKDMPQAFLQMIVVHELAHFKEAQHNKAFYQLCLYMEPEYHQFEFDLRSYLTWLAATDTPLW
ncbi:MAG: YgjP-like metallopeptidase domain-containing protein [Nitrosomonadales bacterium]